MALAFSFDQIKLAKNENVNNSVLNRPLARLYSMLQDLDASANLLPKSNYLETTYLANVFTEIADDDSLANYDDTHTLEWLPQRSILDGLPKPKLTELTDVVTTLPVTGDTVKWNQAIKKFEFAKLPVKINDLNKFDLVDENPVDNSVLTWSERNQSWIAQTATKFIGVGYIYHQICDKPTVVKLPTTSAALSGGEQIVITKVKSDSYNGLLPVLITSPSPDVTIVGRRSILTNNENEDWSSIHLRAVAVDGGFMWVPVACTGTWHPTDITDLTAGHSGGNQIYRPPALTENQIKIQPYNIDVAFSVDESDISKEFDVTLYRLDTNSAWRVDNNQTSDFVYYDQVSNIFSITHDILNGLKPVRTTVFMKSGSKLCQITPNEVYFSLLDNSYSNVNIDLYEYLASSTELSISFKVIVSI